MGDEKTMVARWGGGGVPALRPSEETSRLLTQHERLMILHDRVRAKIHRSPPASPKAEDGRDDDAESPHVARSPRNNDGGDDRKSPASRKAAVAELPRNDDGGDKGAGFLDDVEPARLHTLGDAESGISAQEESAGSSAPSDRPVDPPGNVESEIRAQIRSIDAAKCELECLLDDIELAHLRSSVDDESGIQAQDVSPDGYVPQTRHPDASRDVESEIRAQIRSIDAARVELECLKVQRAQSAPVIARDPANDLPPAAAAAHGEDGLISPENKIDTPRLRSIDAAMFELEWEKVRRGANVLSPLISPVNVLSPAAAACSADGTPQNKENKGRDSSDLPRPAPIKTSPSHCGNNALELANSPHGEKDVMSPGAFFRKYGIGDEANNIDIVVTDSMNAPASPTPRIRNTSTPTVSAPSAAPPPPSPFNFFSRFLCATPKVNDFGALAMVDSLGDDGASPEGGNGEMTCDHPSSRFYDLRSFDEVSALSPKSSVSTLGLLLL